MKSPTNFVRKRLSVLVATPTAHLLVAKGALANMLASVQPLRLRMAPWLS